MKKATDPDQSDVIISSGSYSYTAPDGTLISLTYSADDVGGFQPKVSVLDLFFWTQKLIRLRNSCLGRKITLFSKSLE